MGLSIFNQNINSRNLANRMIRYLSGHQLVQVGPRLLRVTPGEAVGGPSLTADSDLIGFRGAPINIDFNTTGLNGIDVGVVAPNTYYFAYVVRDPITYANGVLASLSNSSPALPAGYTYFRRVGAIRTTAGSDIMAFQQFGTEREREWCWNEPIQQLTAGALAVAPASLALDAPILGTSDLQVHLNIAAHYTANVVSTNDNEMTVREDAAVPTDEIHMNLRYDGVQYGTSLDTWLHPNSANNQIEYFVDSIVGTPVIDMWVRGYKFET